MSSLNDGLKTYKQKIEMKIETNKQIFTTWRSEYEIIKCNEFSCSNCSMKIPCEVLNMDDYCVTHGFSYDECFGDKIREEHND